MHVCALTLHWNLFTQGCRCCLRPASGHASLPLVDESAQTGVLQRRELQLVSEQRVRFNQLLELHEHDVARRLGVAVFGKLLVLTV